MKAIKLVVKGAGIFEDPRSSHTGDRVYLNRDGTSSREDVSPYLKVPKGFFDYRHIANLLRVLCGQRPVPTLRRVAYRGDPLFEDMARRSIVEIETPILEGNKGTTYYPKDMLTPRKSVSDCWRMIKTVYILDGKPVEVKGGCLTWDRLERALGPALYARMRSLVASYGGADTGIKAVELLNRHKTDAAVEGFCKACVLEKKTSLSNVVLNTKPESVTFHTGMGTKLNILMAQQGTPEEVERVDACIYVQVTDEELHLFSNGTGAATFLEGGVVHIEGVEDWSPIIDSIGQMPVEGEMICT